jgi:hypothetical protein
MLPLKASEVVKGPRTSQPCVCVCVCVCVSVCVCVWRDLTVHADSFPLTSSLPLQDCFFYSLVFDPVQKTLLADQGEIRVGCKFQAEIPDRLAEGKQQNKKCLNMKVSVDSLIWGTSVESARCCVVALTG